MLKTTPVNISLPSVYRAKMKYNGSVIMNSAVDASQQLIATDSRLGFGCPGYRAKIAKLTSASTPLHALRHAQTLAVASSGNAVIDLDTSIQIILSYAGFPFQSSNASFPSAWSDSLSEAQQQAVSRFYEKATSAIYQWQSLAFVGDLPQTAQMLVRPAAGIFDLLGKRLSEATNLINRLKRNPQALIKALADSWLEYKFGWVNLHYDLTDAVKAWSKAASDKQVEYVHASSLVPGGSELSQELVSRFTGFQFRHETRPFMATSVTYRGVIVFSRIGGHETMARSFFGLSPEQVVLSRYELIPWSFVVDYFVNLNTILKAALFPYYSLGWVNQTQRIVWGIEHLFLPLDSESRDSIKNAWGKPPSSLKCSDAKLTLLRTQVDRTPVSYVPIPSLQLSPTISLVQGFNLAALAGQALAGSRILKSLPYR